MGLREVMQKTDEFSGAKSMKGSEVGRGKKQRGMLAEAHRVSGGKYKNVLKIMETFFYLDDSENL